MNEVFVAKVRSVGVLAAAALAGSVLVAGPAAADYYIGEPVVKENLQLSPAYLRGIEMEPMPADMSMDKDVIHIEIDIHAPTRRRTASARTSGFPISASPSPSRARTAPTPRRRACTPCRRSTVRTTPTT